MSALRKMARKMSARCCCRKRMLSALIDLLYRRVHRFAVRCRLTPGFPGAVFRLHRMLLSPPKALSVRSPLLLLLFQRMIRSLTRKASRRHSESDKEPAAEFWQFVSSFSPLHNIPHRKTVRYIGINLHDRKTVFGAVIRGRDNILGIELDDLQLRLCIDLFHILLLSVRAQTERPAGLRYLL